MAARYMGSQRTIPIATICDLAKWNDAPASATRPTATARTIRDSRIRTGRGLP